MNFLFVALGGMLGAMARYGLGLWVGNRWSNAYPLGTFLINLSGALLLGFVNVFLLERTAINPAWRIGIGIGFIGAYTTFSTFTYETIVLLEEGSFATALGYVGASIVFGLFAAWLGMSLARML